MNKYLFFSGYERIFATNLNKYFVQQWLYLKIIKQVNACKLYIFSYKKYERSQKKKQLEVEI